MISYMTPQCSTLTQKQTEHHKYISDGANVPSLAVPQSLFQRSVQDLAAENWW